jgi:hypothetical protein
MKCYRDSCVVNYVYLIGCYIYVLYNDFMGIDKGLIGFIWML